MKKLLVTGSNGLLGQKLIDCCINDSRFGLIATSRGVNRHPEKNGYIYEELDICDPKQITVVLDRHRPDVIINTAAQGNVDACERDKEASELINVKAVADLMDYCTRYGIHLIHLSTDFVFDGEEGPYMETDKTSPLSAYGRQKVKAENLLLASDCATSIVRTILVYGVVASLSRTNIVLWAKDALENGQTIKVVNDQFRMPTLAEDLALACLAIADRKATGIYHISGKDLFSICDLVEAVADHWFLEKSFICKEKSSSLHQQALRPKRTGFILDKAYDKLDFVPHSFGEGLAIIDKQLKALGR